jgi:hypothetical protein
MASGTEKKGTFKREEAKMNLQIFAALLICGQLGGTPSESKSKLASEKPVARPAKVISSDVHSLIKKENAAKTFAEREAVTKDLAKLYGDLRLTMRSGSAELLVKDEYRLRQKLVAIVKDLNRRVAKAEVESQKQTAKLNRNPEAYSKSAIIEPTLQGGGTINAANNLIQIIITTIDPEGWQQNGGTYVIEYWAQGMALVVAAPADVHEAIGGSLGGVRRFGP